jgi:hypothetical protein
MFFSKFTSPEQSFSAALRQDMQHQQPQAPQTYGKSLRIPVQQHLSQHEIQRTGLSVQQIITEDKIMVITKMMPNLMKQNGC